jgi:hypothetical protein
MGVNRVAVLLLVVAAGLCGGACGNSATTVTTPTPAKTTLLPTSLVIGGPSTIPPGTTAQLSLTATFSDGSTADVTSSGTWQTDQSGVLKVTAAGLATGGTVGDARVTALYQTARTSKDILVVPPGTFQVTGRVLDQGTPLANATVTATSSGTTVASAETTSAGTFSLLGVGGAVTVQVSSFGYVTQVQSITVSANTTLPDITLPEAAPSADLSGAWTVVFAAEPTCASQLPSDAAQRTYTMNITEQGTHFTATLQTPTTKTAAALVANGRVIGSAFSFDLPEAYYTFQGDLMEQISPGRWVLLLGIVTGTATGSTFAASWSGSLFYYESATGPTAFPTVACEGPNGTATFRRATTPPAKRFRR